MLGFLVFCTAVTVLAVGFKAILVRDFKRNRFGATLSEDSSATTKV